MNGESSNLAMTVEFMGSALSHGVRRRPDSMSRSIQM